MDSSRAASAGDPVGRGPWPLAWGLFVPLAMWLALSKTLLVMSALHAVPYAGAGAAALFHWLWSFTLLRFALALLVGLAIQQLAFPRHRWLALPIAACLMAALVVAVSLSRDGRTGWKRCRSGPGRPRVSCGAWKGPRLQIDILPTIAELLGYRIEGAPLPGVSLLQPVSADRKLFFFSSIDWSFLAARRGSRKYIYSFDRKPMEVFDLERDPHEAQPLQISMQAALSMMVRPVASGTWALAGDGTP